MLLRKEDENRFEISVNYALEFVLLLYDKNGLNKIYTGNHLKWLENCKFFKYARKTRNINKMQLVVDLLDDKKYDCKTVLNRIKRRKIILPEEIHCLSCHLFAVKSRTSQLKQVLD